jgi:hypothetical protein
MSDVTLKTALRELVDELEYATARCKARVESEVFDPDDFAEELNDLVSEILEDSEKAPDRGGFLIVGREALEALRIAISDLSGGDVQGAFESLAWETRKAFGEFKQALAREPAEG